MAELAEVGERREAVLATSIPERPGTFKEFCRLVGPDINISEFKYRRADNSSAHVFYSVNVASNDELGALLARMEKAEFPTIDMSSNDLAKTHLRHLVRELCLGLLRLLSQLLALKFGSKWVRKY